MPNVRFKKDFFPKSGKNRDFLAILEQFLGFFQIFSTFGLIFHNSIYISYKKNCLVLNQLNHEKIT